MILGIDIGGTGIKGALVDVDSGQLLTERKKLATPKPASPESVAQVVNQLIDQFEWRGKDIGFGFPSVIRNGICLSANNIADQWIGINLNEFFAEATGSPVSFINDADAAGLAEAHFGAGKDIKGLMILITLGTGVGSGMVFNGNLIPNFELGSIHWKKGIAEHYVSNKVRKTNDLSWEKWGGELNQYLNHLIDIYSPECIILGGGVSKRFHFFEEFINLKRNTVIKTAQFLNAAGVIGAALSHSKK